MKRNCLFIIDNADKYCALDEERLQKKTFIFKVPQGMSGKFIADCPLGAGEDISLPKA